MRRRLQPWPWQFGWPEQVSHILSNLRVGINVRHVSLPEPHPCIPTITVCPVFDLTRYNHIDFRNHG